MQKNNKSLWQRYKAEYKKQNSRPLPVWRFWLSLLALILLPSLFLAAGGQAVIAFVIMPLTLFVFFVVYEKRPDKYKSFL